MITQHQLDEWKRMADAATPGPWTAKFLKGDTGDKYSTLYECWAFVEPSVCGLYASEGRIDCDLNFIAAAREAMPALISEVGWLLAARELDRHVAGETSRRIEQRIGKMLGYPPLFRDASDVDDGEVCIGDHVTETLVEELCRKHEQLQLTCDDLRESVREAECEINRLRQKEIVLEKRLAAAYRKIGTDADLAHKGEDP